MYFDTFWPLKKKYTDQNMLIQTVIHIFTECVPCVYSQICSNPTYSGTHAFLTHLCPAYGIEYTLLPPEASVKDYEDNIKENTKVRIPVLFNWSPPTTANKLLRQSIASSMPRLLKS